MRTLNVARCPKCGKKFEPSFTNSWLQPLFGEYASDYVTHKCEHCGTVFTVSTKVRRWFNSKIKEEQKK